VAGLTYSWSPAVGLSSPTVANPTVTLTNTTSAVTTQTYTLTTTGAAGCTATATVVVTVNPLPVALAGSAVAICSGATGQLGAATVPGLTYSWSPATGLSSPTVANPTVMLTNTTNAATTQTYTLTTTSAAGCLATATVVVTVSPLPVADAGIALTICSGTTGQLGTTAVAGLTYSWSPATGLSSTTVANPTVTLTNTTGTAATQTYTLTTTNAAGCAATAAVVVTINPVITAGTIGADQTVCVGTTPSALTSTAGAGGGTGTYAYQWEASADGITWAAITSATSPTYAPGPATAVVYYRRRVASGPCGDAVSNVVKVQTQAPLATGVSLATPTSQCTGIAITFTPVPINAGPAPTYRWFVNGTLVATTPTYTSSVLANGDQVQVELTPTAGFCATGIATATVPVTLTPVLLPTVTMSVKTPLPACSGAPVTFSVDNVTNAGATPQYQWQVNGADVAGATSPTFTSSTLSTGQSVTLTLRVPTSCGILTVVSSAVPVAINPVVLVQAGPDKTITEGESVVLEGAANGTYPVTWTPSATLTFLAGNQLRPVAAPLVTTTYTIAGGIGDCASQSSVTVTVTPRVRIPNAISPNGDGRDDTWEIDNIGNYPENHVLVFNRWGNKIFETTNYNRSNEWNGTIKGEPAPIGTYYYVITLGNGKSFSGPLTVIY
ncbi:MAG: T9SS type B sorting domain-containing protein, partial [Hymenobacter sp.]